MCLCFIPSHIGIKKKEEADRATVATAKGIEQYIPGEISQFPLPLITGTEYNIFCYHWCKGIRECLVARI